MTGSVLGSRTFSFDDQLEFAEISGDWNPMHVDPTAARRTIYGDVVVHGVHALVWALELLARGNDKAGLLRLNTKFKRQLYLNRLVSCKLLDLDCQGFKLSVESEGSVAIRIEGSFSQSRRQVTRVAKTLPCRMDCRDRTFAEIRAASGSLPLFLDEDRFGKKFPGLFNLLPCRESAELLATTRLIGMECPGKHSIYSGHSVYFRDHGKDQPQQLDYEVTRTDPRFSMIWMRVAGMIMDGTVTAFARPRPQDQAPVATVCKLVKEDEFVTARALVVGGSRGLGEITAKIIAAGGGDVWITYHRGEKDAERVAGEIRDAGLKCSYSGFDVTAPLTSLPGQLGGGWKPNQLYYFPTPAISFETQQLFSAEKFDSYCRFYVDGFASTLAWLLRLGAKPLSVFYPSTIFLEQFEEHSTEYCAAKAAGEVLCRHLARLPGIDIYAPRLERMTTDQTSRLLPVDAVDSLAAMLTAIRARPVRP